MNTIRTELKRSGRIAGPAGNLYIDGDGSGRGLPVLFLHSFAGSTLHWKAQLDHLRKSRQATAFDFRGHGQSDSLPDAGFSIESLAEDVETVANAVMPEQFILAGHSLGACVAIAYADAHPNRVAGLVLAGTPGKTPAEQARQITASMESDQFENMMTGYTAQLLTGAKPEVARTIRKGIEQLPKKTIVQIFQGLLAFNPLPGIARYKGPKLLVYSADETRLPSALYNQVTSIPSKMIEGAGHWMQMDNPALFNRVLDDFLAIVEPAPDQ